jgi:hypothetical protein
MVKLGSKLGKCLCDFLTHIRTSSPMNPNWCLRSSPDNTDYLPKYGFSVVLFYLKAFIEYRILPHRCQEYGIPTACDSFTSDYINNKRQRFTSLFLSFKHEYHFLFRNSPPFTQHTARSQQEFSNSDLAL